MVKTGIVFSIFVCLFLCTCGAVSDSLTIEIQGHVTDAADNAPIGNVLVQLWRPTGWKTADLLETTYTDGNGFYRLTCTFKPKERCELPYLDFEYQGYYAGAYPPLRCMEGIQTVDVKLEKNRW